MDERSQHGYPAPAHGSPWPDSTAGFVVPGATPHVAVHVHGGGPLSAPVLVAQDAQAWAYATPQGLRLVQAGAAAPPIVATEPGAVDTSGAVVLRTRRRIRWETIVPMIAMLCLLASVGFFIHDFDRITGRDAGSGRASSSSAAATGSGAAAPVTSADEASPAATNTATRAKPAAQPPRSAQRRQRHPRTRVAAPATAPRTAPTSRPSSAATARGGGAPTPPGAATGPGSAGSAKPATRPPAAGSSQGAAPARPNIPNPTGTSGGGASSGTGAIGAAPAGNASSNASSNCQWQVHDGVSMCM